jgi:hypothetical protein
MNRNISGKSMESFGGFLAVPGRVGVRRDQLQNSNLFRQYTAWSLNQRLMSS